MGLPLGAASFRHLSNIARSLTSASLYVLPTFSLPPDGFLRVGSGAMGRDGAWPIELVREWEGTCLSESLYIKSQLNILMVPARVQSLWSEGWGTLIGQVWISCLCQRPGEGIHGLAAHQVTWKGEGATPKERGAILSRTGKGC